jgi:predicted nucleotidyltransferase
VVWVSILNKIVADRLARKREAIETILAELREKESGLGGEYIVYGSVANRTFGLHSDIDILLDFPEIKIAKAWQVAEEICAAQNVPCHISPFSAFKGCDIKNENRSTHA